MYQAVVLSFRIASAGWRNGPMGSSAKSSTWEEIKPYTRTGWWLTSWKEARQKRLGGPGETPNEQEHPWNREPSISWAGASRELPEG